MQPSLSDEQAELHNQLYDEAWSLLKGEVLLDGVHEPARPGFFTKRKIRKSIRKFEQVIDINSMNWNAMLAIAKAHQRFGDMEQSYHWLLRAREFAPDNPSLAKETSLTAAHLGNYEKAIEVVREAIAIKPEDGALHSNLALFLLITGDSEEAIRSLKVAQSIEPEHATTGRILAYARKVVDGSLKQPKSEADIVRDLPE